VGGDDATVVDLGPPATAQPTYPGIRLLPDSIALLDLGRSGAQEVAGKRRVVQAHRPYRQRPTHLGAVLVIEPAGPGAPTQLTRLRGAEALTALFAATFHTDLADGAAVGNVAERLARLAETVPVSRLGVARGLAGLAEAETALRREAATR
jgi:hypothetical protein